MCYVKDISTYAFEGGQEVNFGRTLGVAHQRPSIANTFRAYSTKRCCCACARRVR